LPPRHPGTATIRGVQTAHYRVTIDPAKAAAKVPPSARAAFSAFIKAFAQQDYPAQVWIDRQGRVRRIVLLMPLPELPGAPADFWLTQTTDSYDFGVPVRVTAPPMSQVRDPSKPAPPHAPQSLPRAQAKAAERSVRAFWAAVGANDMNAAALTVVPAQRNCFLSTLKRGVSYKVTSLKDLSARPAGPGHAQVVFIVDAWVRFAGHSSQMSQQGIPDELAVAEIGNRWYVDVRDGTPFSLPCG
jgi:hypothetical protein